MSLVGRTNELERILAVIRAPREGALTVMGGRGTGKSALLSEVPRLSDERTVVLRASASEADWPFSGLTALLNGIDDPLLSRLTDELLRDSGRPMDVTTLAMRLLDGLQQRCCSRTIVVLDDADQLDPGSQAVIGFLARRLAGTEIVIIAGVRDEAADSPFNSLPAITLQPLSYTDTIRMLEAIPARQTAATAVHAVAAATGGNPLAAVELYACLLERQAEGKYALPIPLPCKGSFESYFAGKVGALSQGARQVMDLLALSSRSDIAAVQGVLGSPWCGLDELMASGMVSQSGPYVRIQDQLLRGYVFALMPPAVRTAHHKALAEAAGESDQYAQRWHTSFSTLERQTPFALLRSAVDLIRRGDVPFAVEFIERALTINPWEAETAARLTVIAELLFNRGEFVYAKRYLDWARRITHSPALVLRLTGLAFEIQFLQGASVRSSMVLRLVKELGSHDPAYAASLLAFGALYFAERWEVDDALTLLGQASEFSEFATTESSAVTDRARLLIDSIQGKAQYGAGKSALSMAVLVVQGRALTYSEHHELAREAYSVVRNSLDPSNAIWQETAEYLAVDNEIRAGNVRKAAHSISQLELSEPESKYHRGMRHIFRVWRAFSVGDDAAALRHVADAQHFSGADSNPAITAQLAAWQGHFALVRGNFAESCAHLTRAAEIGNRFANPTLLRIDADLVEVLFRLGRIREATQALHRFESRAVGLRSPWIQMSVARSRAMLTEGEQSLQLFRQAMEGRGGHESPLERARTMLCYAERLGALGRTREAMDGLHRAMVMFQEVGADAWIRHVDSFLLEDRAEAPRADGNPALMILLDHERALAKMVAKGMRNKEIAAALFVSVRTVEVRLTTIYRKLGVESRAQLTALASRKDAPRREPHMLPAV